MSYLGLDLGASRLKALTTDAKGGVIGQMQRAMLPDEFREVQYN